MKTDSFNDSSGPTGLGNTPQNKWQKLSNKELEMLPIDRLAPGTLLHGKVLGYLKDRLTYSERRMKSFYARWELAESRIQAYVNLPDYEQKLKEITEAKGPPKAVSIVVPYGYAVISTICTYHMQTFCGRRPLFQISSNKPEGIQAAQNMELVVQYNSDHERLIKKIWQFLWDGQVYGLSILRTAWKDELALRSVWKPKQNFFGMQTGQEKTREWRKVYSGNEIETIDPYMFFPDPRVPMSEVNKKGEFVFWRSFIGKHEAKTLEADGVLKWIDNAGVQQRGRNTNEDISGRSLLSQGTPIAGLSLFQSSDGGKVDSIQPYIQIDQGSVSIIPAELGLGNGTRPEKWMFTILNKNQIAQAEPAEMDHGMHPVCVSEPYSLGYGFGQPGLSDYIAPIQDTLSWYINSHIHNVRTSLNNMFILDPSRVELQDVQRPTAGKIIRVKPAGYGQDIREMLQQLPVSDVTASHVKDFELFMRMGDALTGVNDNVRGLQDSGGRKTATEVRTSGEAAASRLAAQSRLISAQALVDLTEQMSLNIQQFMEEDVYLNIVGMKGIMEPIHILPEHLVGDFHFPVNDGTLPIDRVAMLDVWKEIYMAVSQDPNLGARYDTGKIFEYIAELGGAKNLSQFELQVSPMQPGQAPPTGAAPIPFRPKSGTTPGIPSPPANRAAGQQT